jgi:hypothetical protein
MYEKCESDFRFIIQLYYSCVCQKIKENIIDDIIT